MGTTLTGTTPQDTYDSLIKVTDNGPLSGTAKYLSDGLGNDSVLALSTSAVGIGTTNPAHKFAISSATDADLMSIRSDASANATILRFGIDGNDANITASGGSVGNLVLKTYGSERMRITSAGAIQIKGASTSTGYQGAIENSETLLTLYGSIFGGTGKGIAFWPTGAAEGMRLTSAGSLCIGTTSPSGGALVHIAAANGTTYAANAQLRVSGKGTNNNVAQILFSDDALSDGKISYFPSAAAAAQRFSISARSTETDFQITGDGYVRLGSGMGGLQFGGATAAANALDDYEEGTFTPTIEGTSSAGTGTYASQFGQYTKVGNMVYFRLFVSWTAHTGTGDLNIAGLPFTANATRTAPCSSWVSQVAYTTVPNFTVSNGTTKINALQQVNDNFSTGLPIDTLGNITLSGTYHV